MYRELVEPSVESYDLRLGEPSATIFFFSTATKASLVLSSDIPCDLPNWQWVPTRH